MEVSGKPLLEMTAKRQRIGIAADHGGYELNEYLAEKLRCTGHEVVDFGDSLERPTNLMATIIVLKPIT
jgi:ribose 5-phosphate isomerase RpiB